MTNEKANTYIQFLPVNLTGSQTDFRRHVAWKKSHFELTTASSNVCSFGPEK
jgi:hypothetical protein